MTQDDELKMILRNYAEDVRYGESIEGAIEASVAINQLFTDKLKNLPEMQMTQGVVYTGGVIDRKKEKIQNELRTAILKSWEE